MAKVHERTFLSTQRMQKVMHIRSLEEFGFILGQVKMRLGAINVSIWLITKSIIGFCFEGLDMEITSFSSRSI